MRRIPALLGFGLALAACQLNLPSGASAGGDTTTGTGAGTSGAGGSGAEHPCDGKKDCNACHACALNVQCATLATACAQSSGCNGIDQCFTICGSDADCKGQCYLQNPDGEATYRALLSCIFCDACPSDCAGYTTCS
ncbi:MAG: hypothetical protein ABJE95_15780 [Byssovorax sp.]